MHLIKEKQMSCCVYYMQTVSTFDIDLGNGDSSLLSSRYHEHLWQSRWR